jgi:hypothetical protein
MTSMTRMIRTTRTTRMTRMLIRTTRMTRMTSMQTSRLSRIRARKAGWESLKNHILIFLRFTAIVSRSYSTMRHLRTFIVVEWKG